MSRYYGFGQENLPVPGSDIRQEPTASPLMSVDEMGALLGLKKTEQYWLVHKNVFDTWISPLYYRSNDRRSGGYYFILVGRA